jgi:hydroxymethylbilane synthase
MSGPRSHLRLATRASPLARWQAEEIARRLAGFGVTAELVTVSTTGDLRPEVPIGALGAQGVFAKEVQAAVLTGRADVAVHSAKDLPPLSPPGLVLAAVPEREDPRDALVGRPLSDLRPGTVVATGAPRRRVQLAGVQPGLCFVELRGNIGTRLDRVPAGGAAVVAACALSRLGLAERAAEVLDPGILVPQVGQGALAAECREDDGEVRKVLARIEHQPSRLAVDAERAYLSELGPGCRLPVGAWARVDSGTIVLSGFLASADGTVVGREVARGQDPVTVGRSLAARLLEACGGRGVLFPDPVP